MYYDLNAIRVSDTCQLCKLTTRPIYIAARSGDDESDPDYTDEFIVACERCIVDGLLDGLAPR